MDFTITKYKLANKLFGTPMPMATLNWNNPTRKAARKETLQHCLEGVGLVVFAMFICAGESLMELFFNYIGM